jgi:glutathione S-transferase
MIIVHHLEDSRSQRILWMLEEVGLPYQVKRYERRKTMAAPPELRKVHPLGKSPVIVDGETTVAETGAIVEYLVDAADGKLGAPGNRDAALRFRYYLHYAEGSVMTNMLMWMVVGMVPLLGKSVQKRLKPLVSVHLDFIESELAKRPWFAGDEFTAADIMMSFPLEFASERMGALDGRPNIAAWLDKIHARPAYATALEKGGPYAFA